ncbi:MAG: GNAT family N-acetyltransferase [Armatimonadetes bacterium]|nr:GNAT family N-acetyltransferase [Armatimonadota bacterium]
MPPTIRPYRPGDEEAVNRVIKSVFDAYEWLWDPATENKDTYDIEQYYLRRDGAFWVLEEGDEVVGTVAIRPLTPDRCGLYRLYLLADQRGKGYGRLLFRHAVDEAKSRGFKEMEIWSDKMLDVSHVMYKNAGSESLGDRRIFDPDYGVPYEEWGYLLRLD